VWPDGRDLPDLLSPVSTRRFLTRYWGRRPFFIRGAPNKFAHLQFDLAALESAIRDNDPRDRMRVRFVGAGGKVEAGPGDLARFSIREGEWTVCADWINDRFERLASFCAGIKAGLSLPGSVFMTCYASPDGHGFGTHWDGQSSFILQLEGSKRWRFSPKPAVPWPPVVLANAGVVPEMVERYPWMRVRFPGPADEATFAEQVLAPGDVLYLPAGTWHRARAIGYSVALTMACVPMTAADFVDDVIRGQLSPSIDWRRSVPPVPTTATRPDRLPAPVKRFFDRRLAELRKRVRTLRADDLYEAWAHHVASFDTLLAPERAEVRALAPTDTLTVAGEFPVRYVERPAEGTLSVYYLNRRADLAHGAIGMVEAMLKARTFAARAAVGWLGDGFAWEDVEPALRGLVEAGILRLREARPRGKDASSR
jgi:ribosomal protein L16 Arg81 hydroxylase